METHIGVSTCFTRSYGPLSGCYDKMLGVPPDSSIELKEYMHAILTRKKNGLWTIHRPAQTMVADDFILSGDGFAFASIEEDEHTQIITIGNVLSISDKAAGDYSQIGLTSYIKSISFPDSSKMAILDGTNTLSIYNRKEGRWSLTASVDVLGESSDIRYMPEANAFFITLSDGRIQFIRPDGAILFLAKSSHVGMNWCLWSPQGAILTRNMSDLPFKVRTKGNTFTSAQSLISTLFHSTLWNDFITGKSFFMETPNAPPELKLKASMSAEPFANGLDIPWSLPTQYVSKEFLKAKKTLKVYLNDRIIRNMKLDQDQAHGTVKSILLDDLRIDELQTIHFYLFQDSMYFASATVKKAIGDLYCHNSKCIENLMNSLQEIRRPYISSRRFRHLAIGINEYESPAWNLSYAVADAQLFRNIATQQKGLVFDHYQPIVLTSPVDHYTPILPDKQAIQSIFKAWNTGVIDTMLASIPTSHLNRLQEDDVVLITFSGHGVVGPDGQLYLMPRDIGKNRPRSLDQELFNHLISSSELARWIEPLQAKEIYLILDACHTAAAIDELNFRYDPSVSFSLGQLALDKKIHILAATQASDVALESEQTQHGLLTYALIEEGLKHGRADLDQNGYIDFLEWIQYPVQRVAEISKELRNGNAPAKGVVIVGSQLTPEGNIAQTPTIFDFGALQNGYEPPMLWQK